MSGGEVEQHVREVAALLGVADFIYSPTVITKGRATREVSDGLLMCAQGGAVLQVKSRNADAAEHDSDAAARWLRKHFRTAVAQGEGTRRSITAQARAGDPVEAIAVRALDFPPERHDEFAVALDADSEMWPLIVVLDHAGATGVELPVPQGVFPITLTDWRELNRAVRSVNGILRYVTRVLTADPPLVVSLGHERDRFVEIAHADARYAAEHDATVPWFTLDETRDDLGVALYRELLERVWVGDARGPVLSARECRLILNHLDDVPISLQATVGQWMLRKRRALASTGLRQSGIALLHDRPLVYVCDNERNESDPNYWKAELTVLTAARMATWREQRGTEAPAVCVGVREADGGIEYTFVYIEGRLDLPADVRHDVEARYGIPNLVR